jgi:hypothetical protein
MEALAKWTAAGGLDPVKKRESAGKEAAAIVRGC